MARNPWTRIEVETNTEGNLAVFGDGDVRRDIDLYLTDRQYDEMKTGYRCVRCFGLVDSAFPETCGLPGCDGYPNGFPMRERQREVLESEMHDERRRKETARTDIWLPGGIQ